MELNRLININYDWLTNDMGLLPYIEFDENYEFNNLSPLPVNLYNPVDHVVHKKRVLLCTKLLANVYYHVLCYRCLLLYNYIIYIVLFNTSVAWIWKHFSDE